MIRFRVSLIGLTLVLGLTAAPDGLQAGPQATQPLPVMTDVAARDRGAARILLAQAEPTQRRVQFPRVTDSTSAGADAQAASSGSEQPGPVGALPIMPDPYESLLIVLAAAVAGVIGLWLGHIAGVVRLFRNDEAWPRTRA